jgi:hypothetical protein
MVAGTTPFPSDQGGASDEIWDDTSSLALEPSGSSRDEVVSRAIANSTSVILDPEIEALDLAPTARKAAYALKRMHPSVIFTSGRRNKRDQARAMSENVILNRKWIEQTYAKTIACDNCQKWVDDNPDKTTQREIEEGLASVIDALPDAELARLSKHLSGDAFDVQPVNEDAERIKATIRRLPGLKIFLDMEGGLIRWHAQF